MKHVTGSSGDKEISGRQGAEAIVHHLKLTATDFGVTCYKDRTKRDQSFGRSVMNYGQFCPIAKATEILGEKWTILIIRELIMGGRRFNELQRG
ncbi:MAG: winged helix-turn-helix transcriptional regulator, partial [Sphingomonadaceae bacterium]